jgi:glycine dehydrogenase subunit 2
LGLAAPCALYPGPVVTVVEEGSRDVPHLYGFTMQSTHWPRESFFGNFAMMVRAYVYISMHVQMVSHNI